MQTWIRNRHPVTLVLMWISRRSWWRHPNTHGVPDQPSWRIGLRYVVAHG